MPLVRVDLDNADQVRDLAALLEAARRVDDPDAIPDTVADVEDRLRYGWDLHPHLVDLYFPDGSDQPVGVLDSDLPTRDNRHLAAVDVTVHPAHRRQGHGSALFAETVRRTRAAGRTTLWMGGAEDDAGAQAFLARHGLARASAEARRRQLLADVDQTEIDRLATQAAAAAAGYRLERLQAPLADDVLAELVEVSAAINDAPMGGLTFEDEVFDVQRLRDHEQAQRLSGNLVYRIVARHEPTGVAGGHTLVVFSPRHPTFAWQGDTAVAREHRGRRLGLLLKTAMMRWIAEVQPQIEMIETWNNVDNRFMIDVNEALGYRLSRVFTTHELAVS